MIQRVPSVTTESETDWVVSALEQGQLVAAKKQPLPRRKLGTGELIVIWVLRGYVIFMIAAVIMQILHAK